MSHIADPLILPEDVALIPVIELSDDARASLEYETGDVAVSRAHSRSAAKIVSQSGAELLTEFRSPKTIVEAVVRFSLGRSQAPGQVLEEAFPMIQTLVNAQFLTPADAPESKAVEASLQKDASFGPYRIVRCLQTMRDTELFLASDSAGQSVALKLAQHEAGPAAAMALQREAHVLERLRPGLHPGLNDFGADEGRPYLALKWQPGISAAAAARELAAMGETRRLLSLCAAILDAYAELHGQAVLHGDIHPDNILVDADGKPWLIDFGLARVLDPAAQASPAPRGGVAFYFEPEYAVSARAGGPVPTPTLQGEQYALAALVHHLLTGGHYLNFALEEQEMLRQIAEDAPLAFADHGAPAMPEVERVLARALSKRPEARFSHVAGFAAAFRRAAEVDAADERAAAAPRQAQAFLEDVRGRLHWGGALINDETLTAPSASINYGAAGIAYFLYRQACLNEDAELLALADVWAARAEQALDEEGGFYNVAIEITPETVGRVSPYHTPAGVFAIRAMIAQAMGDRASQARALRGFLSVVDQPCDMLDLTLGRASVLLGFALLLETISDRELVDELDLRAAGDAVFNDLWAAVSEMPAIDQAGDQVAHLGMAHGWAGFLYAAMRWRAVAGGEPPADLTTRLNQLADLAEPVGRGARWPWNLGADHAMPGWCNGSAGFVYLWTMAHRAFGEARWLALAEQAAWNAWEHSSQAPNLCCGLAGRGYALAHLYNHTGDGAWLRRARRLAARAAERMAGADLDEKEGYAHSLYKGDVGVAALVAELRNPEWTAMPFFESERTCR